MRLLLVLLLASCAKSDKLAPLYCAGGVFPDNHGEMDCVRFYDGKLDSDPATVGNAIFAPRYKDGRYSVRRVDSTHYDLFLHGALAGSFKVENTWIHVTFLKPPGEMSFRSDRPSIFQ
jgi:hypothetical protein